MRRLAGRQRLRSIRRALIPTILATFAMVTPAQAACNASHTVCVPQVSADIHAAQTAKFGLDHAWGTLTPGALRAWGGQFVLGYESFDAGKNLSAAEVRAMSAVGIPSATVWETFADRALAGYGAGRADALEAVKQLRAIGAPSWAPIYFAVDFDSTGIVGQLFPYFRGVGSVLPVSRVGAYGGYPTIAGLFNARLVGRGWQTLAWSYGRWDPRACLQQYAINDFVAGIGVDYDRAVCDFGGWRIGQTLVHPVIKVPQPSKLQRELCAVLVDLRADHLGSSTVAYYTRGKLARERVACTPTPHRY